MGRKHHGLATTTSSSTMTESEVKIRAFYDARVSGRLVRVRIMRVSPNGGWEALNMATGRYVHIRTAARLRSP
jgi:hypothetical protein